jgi:LDH2 family malate/lactate/ureidoglycolate dehydrogenase
VGALGPVFKQLGAGTVLTKKSLGFDVPEGWLLDEEGKFVTRAGEWALRGHVSWECEVTPTAGMAETLTSKGMDAPSNPASLLIP